MPLRTVVLFTIGEPLGGFRMAFAPGIFGLNNVQAFTALERTLQALKSVLSVHPPDTWQRISEGDALELAEVMDFGEREGFIDFTTDVTKSKCEVVLRAFLPFRIWPFGGWAVYAGWHRNGEEAWVPFSQDELATLW